MKPAAKWLLVATVAMVAAGAGMEFGRRSRLPSATAVSGAATDQLLTLKLVSPNGRVTRLTDWQGKILVVNFWATWCPPCREEMPEFSRAQGQYKANGVQFVGIAVDEAANVVEYSKKTPAAYPLLLGPSELPSLMAKLGNQQQVLPFTVILSRDGKLVYRHLGQLNKSDLEKQLAPLL